MVTPFVRHHHNHSSVSVLCPDAVEEFRGQHQGASERTVRRPLRNVTAAPRSPCSLWHPLHSRAEYGVRIPANISFQNWSSCPVIPSTNAWSEPLRAVGDGGGGAAVLAGMLAVTGGSGEAPTHVMSPSGVIAQ